MQKPDRRTGLSFAASDVTFQGENSRPSPDFAAQKVDIITAPNEASSSLPKREMTTLNQQIGRLVQQLEQQRKEHKQELEQQRKDIQEQVERLTQMLPKQAGS